MRADRNAEVLKHMVKYCDQIEETVLRFQKDFAVFAKDHIYQNAVALCVLQIDNKIDRGIQTNLYGNALESNQSHEKYCGA